MAVTADILIVAETVHGKFAPAVAELVGLADRLGRAATVAAVLIGDASDALVNELIARGVDRVLRAPMAGIEDSIVENRLATIQAACARVEPRLVLLPHGIVGAELAPRLAFRLDGAVATGCVDVAIEGERVACTRPCYGGLVRETAEYSVAPVIATIRAGVFEPALAQVDRRGEIEDLVPTEPVETRTRIVERKLDADAGVRLEDARAIVAGGRGLEGPEGFRVLEGLAAELGAAVGASRVPCDLGWCPHSWQIGLTGKTVTPELYIAVGISGAGHHMAGCGNAKTIVAINNDPEAAIFQDARFGVVGDFREVVPAFAAEVRRLTQAAQG